MSFQDVLRIAVKNEEFVLRYRPIVSLRAFEISGFQALVRWRRLDGILARLSEFSTAAEHADPAVQLGSWVLRETCRAACRIQQRVPRNNPLIMSMNVSPPQLAQPGFVAQVREAASDADIDPGCLQLEIAERAFVDDIENTIAKLREVRSLGISIAISDFGTSYSSLAHVRHMPADMLKIDRSLIARMNDGPEILRMIENIIDLAHDMKIATVADSVESAEQIGKLRELGCQFVQGNYFSRAVDISGACTLLSQPLRGADAKNDRASIEKGWSPYSSLPSLGQRSDVDEWLRENISGSYGEYTRYKEWLGKG